jgi:hypothetical protein
MTKSTKPDQNIYEVLKADFARPENRYLNVPLIRLITSGRLPKKAMKDVAICAGRSRRVPTSPWCSAASPS